jgi:AraC-like DNA-binding protein
MKQSEPKGWENNPSGRPYGLSFFPGEKVDVSFGQLDRSYWYEHSSKRVRIVFTFNNVLGLMETTYGNVMGDPSWCLEPNQFCIIPPRLETTLDWLRRAELVVLYLDSPLFGDNDPFPHQLIVDDFQALARCDRCLSQLAHLFLTLCRQSDPPERDFVEGIGIALASRTLAQYFSPGESSPKVRSGLPIDVVDNVTRYIDAHLGEPILAGDLAALAGLSSDHFARRFKIATEMSPKQFVLKRRVEKVADLLRSGKYNVSEAAREVGFHDLSHLNRCFRDFFGYSPKTVIKTALASGSYQ